MKQGTISEARTQALLLRIALVIAVIGVLTVLTCGSCHRAATDRTATSAGGGKGGDIGTLGMTLSRQAEANIGLRVEEAQIRTIERLVRVPATIRPRFGAEAWASSRAPGVVTGLEVPLGGVVARGGKLADIESPELQRLQVDLLKAHSNLQLQKANLTRVESLRSKNIASEKEALATENDYKRVQSEARGLRIRLSILGLSESEIDGVERGEFVPSLAVCSPIAGTLVELFVTLGEAVDASKRLFTVVDLSDLVADGDVSENLVHQISRGQMTRIRPAALSGRVFEGSIFYVGSVVEPEKRTVRVKTQIRNPDESLKPEMFAELSIVVGKVSDALCVPRQAVIGDGARRSVFLKNGDEYMQQEVSLGVEDDLYVEVTDGLFPGDLVVTQGVTELWAEMLKPTLVGHQ